MIQMKTENRMNFEHNDLFENYQKATFCTYKELKQMQESGLVVLVLIHILILI